MTTVVTAIFSVFTAVSDWLVDAIQAVVPLFYAAETGLTFLGTLAIIGVGISVIFLCIGIVQRFLKFGA